jgi:ATP-binding cassette, subfamily B, vacuolar membrane transporter HMT1/ACLQ
MIDAVQIAMASLRVILLLAMILVYWFTSSKTETATSPEETESLLQNGQPALPESASYGTVSKKYRAASTIHFKDAQQTTWMEYVLGFHKLFPYLW